MNNESKCSVTCKGKSECINSTGIILPLQVNSILSDRAVLYLLLCLVNVTVTIFSSLYFLLTEVDPATTGSGKVLAKQYRGLLFVHCCSWRTQ